MNLVLSNEHEKLETDCIYLSWEVFKASFTAGLLVPMRLVDHGLGHLYHF